MNIRHHKVVSHQYLHSVLGGPFAGGGVALSVFGAFSKFPRFNNQSIIGLSHLLPPSSDSNTNSTARLANTNIDFSRGWVVAPQCLNLEGFRHGV